MALWRRLWRYPLLAAGLLVLLIGMWGGLLRTGWPWPWVAAATVPYHGALMIGGFLGTLICLERAVALGQRWTYLAPLAAAAAAFVLAAGVRASLGEMLLTLASALLVAQFVLIVYRQWAAFTIVMGLGALAWLIGNLIWWSGRPLVDAVPWWTAFLVLTIAGERLELSRFLPRRPGQRPAFQVASGLYGAGVILGTWWPGLGWALAGVGLLSLAIWLAVFDLARRTVRQQGLTRFVALCLLTGYFWLATAGVMAVIATVVLPLYQGLGGQWVTMAPMAGLMYDAILHAIMLGFVFGMIFGHAPIIFPAVLGVRIIYRPVFYAHLALLEASVALRITVDLLGWGVGRQWMALGNVLAILLFLGVTVSSIRWIEASPSAPPAQDARPIQIDLEPPSDALR